MNEFNYDWSLKNTNFTKDKGKVFSCFACGGGSTMGYKLAGFDVIGCNEIDHRMMYAYCRNHNPKYPYLEPIQELKGKDLPKELFDLDILDGSPPCSTFSMNGSREETWGVERTFKEGQAKQVLDTLFFDFIDLAAKLQPKVVVAENVKGILLGKAKDYVRRIHIELDKAGYYCQHWLLDASKMGIPQKRERVFFIGLRKDLAKQFLFRKDMFTVVPKLNLNFNFDPIPFSEIYEANAKGLKEPAPFIKKLWPERSEKDSNVGDTCLRLRGKKTGFSTTYLHKQKVCGTLTAHPDNSCQILFDEMRYLSLNEWCKIGSFPKDYDFSGLNPGYLIGMSVPPVMLAQISSQIYYQWLAKINK
jgi:DNA (cytosine-5)-methyltransferase 1|nr:MAG: C-5 cytosine-specific DNA methylase [Bacteriophage sp.]